MRLVSYRKNGGAAVAVMDGGDLIDLSALVPDAPADMKSVIAGWDALRGKLDGKAAASAAPRTPANSAQLLPPVPDPGKIVCLGLNYVEHAKEGGHQAPDYPALFIRATTSLVGPSEPVVRPRVSEKLDYEVELMVVIGRRCRHVPEADALSKVFGYTVFNDVSVRDYQRKTTQWTAGKTFDGTGPMGPALVTADELPAGADGLGIRSRLNGQVLQDGNTSDMIFGVARTVSILSEVMTLEPGDVIAMGTPSGVGHARKPPLWMKPGDVIECEIDGIGTLSNPVVDEG
jgi:2-keto-4-pentenoate hydratase/2-oxohepta-3-ene-1,7-dioic acid hydratase in catechol pathway